jgi:hypothetical protein
MEKMAMYSAILIFKNDKAGLGARKWDFLLGG